MKQMIVRGAQTEIPFSISNHYTTTCEHYHATGSTTRRCRLRSPRKTRSTRVLHALDQGISRMENRSFRKWSEMEPVYGKIRDAYSPASASPKAASRRRTGACAQKTSSAVSANGMPVEVPYMYCSDDEWART